MDFWLVLAGGLGLFIVSSAALALLFRKLNRDRSLASEIYSGMRDAPLLLRLFFAPAELIFYPLRNAGSLEERIASLSGSLRDAAGAISEMEREISARSALVHQLQDDASRARRLAELNQEEVEAVAQSLRAEFARSERRALWITFLQGAFWFVVGAVASHFLA